MTFLHGQPKVPTEDPQLCHFRDEVFYAVDGSRFQKFLRRREKPVFFLFHQAMPFVLEVPHFANWSYGCLT